MNGQAVHCTSCVNAVVFVTYWSESVCRQLTHSHSESNMVDVHAINGSISLEDIWVQFRLFVNTIECALIFDVVHSLLKANVRLLYAYSTYVQYLLVCNVLLKLLHIVIYQTVYNIYTPVTV